MLAVEVAPGELGAVAAPLTLVKVDVLLADSESEPVEPVALLDAAATEDEAEGASWD